MGFWDRFTKSDGVKLSRWLKDNLPGANGILSGLGYKPRVSAAAAPTTGTAARGDIVWNSAPSAGGTPGWVCTTAGSPGTWKAMANLAA